MHEIQLAFLGVTLQCRCFLHSPISKKWLLAVTHGNCLCLWLWVQFYSIFLKFTPTDAEKPHVFWRTNFNSLIRHSINSCISAFVKRCASYLFGMAQSLACFAQQRSQCSSRECLHRTEVGRLGPALDRNTVCHLSECWLLCWGSAASRTSSLAFCGCAPETSTSSIGDAWWR
jgi:hypothetical protein